MSINEAALRYSYEAQFLSLFLNVLINSLFNHHTILALKRRHISTSVMFARHSENTPRYFCFL